MGPGRYGLGFADAPRQLAADEDLPERSGTAPAIDADKKANGLEKRREYHRRAAKEVTKGTEGTKATKV